MKKNIIAVVTALCLIAALFPVFSLAASAPGGNNINTVSGKILFSAER